MTDEADKDVSRDWITVKEAQKVIGGKRTVTARTVRRWIKRHGIPTHRQYREGGYTLLLARQEVEALTQPDKALDSVRARMSELVKVSDLDIFSEKMREELKGLDAALHAQAEHTRATRRKLRAVTVLAVLALGGAVVVWAAVNMQVVQNKAAILSSINFDRIQLAEVLEGREQEREALRATRAELEVVRAELAEVKAALKAPPGTAPRAAPSGPTAERRWWALWRD